jgi:hypothetical protein
MKRVIAALALLLSTLLLPAPAAQADDQCTFYGQFCGTIYHYAPDDGYDAPFLVACDWRNGGPANGQYIHEGVNSANVCRDVDAVYVNAGYKYVCLNFGSWSTFWSGAGWKRINNAMSAVCVYQAA